MALDPRTLKGVASEKVKHDAPCARCGTNLKGLAYWTRCPHCGLDVARTVTPDGEGSPDPPRLDENGEPVRPVKSPWVESDPLRPRPLLSYLDLERMTKARLGLGMTLVSVGAALFAGSMLVAWLILFWRSQTWLDMDLSTARMIAGVCAGLAGLPGVGLWVAGQVMVTPGLPPKPTTRDEAIGIGRTLAGMMVNRSAAWPRLVRLAPALWAWPLLCVVASSAGDELKPGLVLAGVVGVLIACLAHAITCVHLRELALIMHDELAARRMFESSFLIAFVMVVHAVVLTPGDLLTREAGLITQAMHGFFGILMVLAFVAAVIWPVSRFMVGAFSLAAACRGSVIDDVAKAAREQGKREEVRRRFEEAEAKRRAGEEV